MKLTVDESKNASPNSHCATIDEHDFKDQSVPLSGPSTVGRVANSSDIVAIEHTSLAASHVPKSLDLALSVLSDSSTIIPPIFASLSMPSRSDADTYVHAAVDELYLDDSDDAMPVSPVASEYSERVRTPPLDCDHMAEIESLEDKLARLQKFTGRWLEAIALTLKRIFTSLAPNPDHKLGEILRRHIEALEQGYPMSPHGLLVVALAPLQAAISEVADVARTGTRECERCMHTGEERDASHLELFLPAECLPPPTSLRRTPWVRLGSSGPGTPPIIVELQRELKLYDQDAFRFADSVASSLRRAFTGLLPEPDGRLSDLLRQHPYSDWEEMGCDSATASVLQWTRRCLESVLARAANAAGRGVNECLRCSPMEEGQDDANLIAIYWLDGILSGANTSTQGAGPWTLSDRLWLPPLLTLPPISNHVTDAPPWPNTSGFSDFGALLTAYKKWLVVTPSSFFS